MADKRPHIFMVLVDDWGWNDTGYHRLPGDREIQTPTINRLVKEGIELDRHYVYHYCSPSRASLQSGRLPVHVGWPNDDPSSVNLDDPVGGFAGIPPKMTGIAERMRQAGYRTHATGKWDAGMAAWAQTPMGRGYETWLGYYHHANDYYTERLRASGPSACQGIVDLWNTTGPARSLNGTAYEEEIFLNNTLDVLGRHNASEPLFFFHAFHQIHAPLEVPQSWEDRFAFVQDESRRKYVSMVAYMDHALGQIVEKLESKGMWDNTLMVVSSDNGGPTYYVPGNGLGYGGASNKPLKGGKMSDWEGGVRVNAFVTGGAVPSEKRATVLTDYIHLADWYATFCTIAGLDPTDVRAAQASLPPVDGVDHSRLLLGSATPGTGNRTEIHHSVRALTQGRWKLITGGYMDEVHYHHMNKTYGPMGTGLIGWSDYGNGWGMDAIRSTFFSFQMCGSGCLYDIVADPYEEVEVSKQHPDVLDQMMRRLNDLNKEVFLPNRGSMDKRACSRWGGFAGPFIDMPEDRLRLDEVIV